MMENPLNKNSTHTTSLEAALLKDLAALPKSVRPANDAWQKIAGRIASERPSRRANNKSFNRGWLALAASVLLVALTTVFIVPGTETENSANRPFATINTEPLRLNEIGARVPATSIEREYQAAFREYLGLDLMQSGPGRVEGAEMQQHWELMQQLEQDLLAALELDPANPWLLQRLMHLRARQLQFLRIIADSGPVSGRNLI